MISEDVKNKAWPQYLATATACLGVVCGGTIMGWTSPSMIMLLSEDSPIQMTYDDISWIASTISIGVAVSALFSAYAIDRLGRKPVLLISSVFYIVSWLCALLANNLTLLYVSRIVGGLGLGISLCCTMIYIGEVVEKHRRGSLGIFTPLSLITGILFESIVGPRVTFRMLNGISLVFPILFLITFFFMPESPYFLVSRDMNDRAYASLMWLRGQTQVKQIQNDVDDIKDFCSNKSLNFIETIRAIFSKSNRKALLLIAIAIFAQQFSGLNGITNYTERISNLIATSIKPSDAVIIINTVPIGSTLLTMFLIDKVGRKIILMVSLSGTVICTTVLGTYLFLSANGIIGAEYAWIAMAGLCAFQIFQPLGLSSIPFVLLGEIFPNETKAWSNCIATIYQSILAFIIIKLFQIFDESIGAHMSFFMYALSLFISGIFIVILMPETKNKSFIEIQKILQKKHKIKTTN